MVHETRHSRAGRGFGSLRRLQARAVFTVLGIAALLIGAVLNWEADLAGNKLTLRSLIQNDFTTRSDAARTVAAASVLIAVVAVLSLLDRTGWLIRLAGFAAVVLFVMFAVQVFRHYGENFGTAYHALRPGAWCELGAGVVLLLGGLIRYRRRISRPEMATQAAAERSTAETIDTTEATETTGQNEEQRDEQDALDTKIEQREQDEQPVLTAEKS